MILSWLTVGTLQLQTVSFVQRNPWTDDVSMPAVEVLGASAQSGVPWVETNGHLRTGCHWKISQEIIQPCKEMIETTMMGRKKPG